VNWGLLIPELYYFAVCGILLALSMVARPNPRRGLVTVLFFAALGVVVCLASVRLEGTLFAAAYRVDLFSQVFKVLLAVSFFLIVSLCTELNAIAEGHHLEFYFLLTTATVAMMLLVSSVELLTIYVALELSSYSLYLVVPLRRGHDAAVEAGIKYLLVGTSASAVMLFGFACLYGVIHTTQVAEIVRVLPGMLGQPVATIGLLFALCGFFFKLAVFPFHFWAPGVYQGAANQVTTFIATASKVAAIAILMRIVALGGGGDAYLVNVLVTLSIASMTLGNLVAIRQKDMKRFLAYSAVAHAGYVLIGLVGFSSGGYASTIFYAFAYLVMKFTCFLVLVKVAADGSDLQIAQLAGLHRRSPLLAMALMVGVFGLAGIPPTVGFTGKFLLFTAAVQKGQLALVFIAMINVVISLYYYLLVVKAAYLLEPDEDQPRIRLSAPVTLLLWALMTLIVGAGIFPAYLLDVADAAARALLAL
jgi:NADH-quinone oxidoreductase subunit N